jgi:hypothetical protein
MSIENNVRDPEVMLAYLKAEAPGESSVFYTSWYKAAYPKQMMVAEDTAKRFFWNAYAEYGDSHQSSFNELGAGL